MANDRVWDEKNKTLHKVWKVCRPNMSLPDMNKCPACEKNIPAYQTVVGEVSMLCKRHTDELDGTLHGIIKHHDELEASSAVQPPNTESDKSIDTILKKAWEHGYYSNNYPSNPNMTWFSDDKQALYSLLMDVIGEDEFDQQELNETENGSEVPFLVRNGLRAEQRQKLKELFGKEK